MAGRDRWQDYEVPRSAVGAGAVERWGQRHIDTEDDARVIGVTWRDEGGRVHHAVYAKNLETGEERSWRVRRNDYLGILDWARDRYGEDKVMES